VKEEEKEEEEEEREEEKEPGIDVADDDEKNEGNGDDGGVGHLQGGEYKTEDGNKQDVGGKGEDGGETE
jgi:hypothetical protein